MNRNVGESMKNKTGIYTLRTAVILLLMITLALTAFCGRRVDLPGTGRGGCAGTRRGFGDGGVARRNAAEREQTEAETQIVLYPAIC